MKNTCTCIRRRGPLFASAAAIAAVVAFLGLTLLLRDVQAFTVRSLPLLGRRLEQRHLRKQQQQQKQLQDETTRITTTTTTTTLDEDTTDGNVVAPTKGPRRRVTRVAGGIASTIRSGLARLPRRRIESQLQDEDISDVATASAAIYMNPETATMASNLQITWEPNAAQHIRNLHRVSNPTRPLMIGVVGIPGSGKSTSCDILAEFLQDDEKLLSQLESSKNGNGKKRRKNNNNGKKNKDTFFDTSADGSNKQEPLKPLVMPMDGYHYSMAQLLEFPNAEDAIYRRGACDTFDSEGLARDLERIAHGLEPIVQIPGFDHARGDPTPAQHTFSRDQHNVVICEGLYLLHDQDGWERVQKYLDWTIYIKADVDTCIERLKERNKCIPGYSAEEIAVRCDAVDRVNALLASDTASKYAAQIVDSGARF
mmetsp:Transcript_31882/g.77429  ORF Transcript_31882/g.77429 Transcript_31882/m.77429 type:complete len:425 (+) Transcript_31882:438-1712(+)